MGDTALMKAEAFPDDKIALIKRTVAAGTTDDELELFLYTAKRMGLDPLARQIHAVMRWDSQARRKVMTIQVGIDGFRLVADRTGCYAPGVATEFEYAEDGKLVVAIAYVRKFVQGGWVGFSHAAHYTEYVGRKKNGEPNHMWETKKHIMLGKCAEAGALRKGFPAELSGVYTWEEMEQADNQPIQAPPAESEPVPASREKVNNGLWVELWKAASEADMCAADIWDAVFTVRPALKTTADITKEVATDIIAKLKEEDFAALFRGVAAMAEAKKRDEATHDPETGEIPQSDRHPNPYSEDREPGSDDDMVR